MRVGFDQGAQKAKKSESASSATTFLRSQGFRVHVEEGCGGVVGRKLKFVIVSTGCDGIFLEVRVLVIFKK